MAKNAFTILFLSLTLGAFLPQPKAVAFEKEFTVFDMRKSLPLHDTDPVYRDYYVNIGADNGVRVGSILAVYRHVPVIDVYRNKAEGDLVVPIGHMKVIQVQKSMSVCRVASIASEKEIPVVQYETVMMGDQVQVAENQAPQERAPAMTASAASAPEAPATAPAEPARAPTMLKAGGHGLKSLQKKHRHHKKAAPKNVPLA